MAARTAGGMVMAALLAACATEQGPVPAALTPQSDMTGRWLLTAPNAPPCGMEFGGAPGQVAGPIVPEGGCPGKFFTSRRWTFAQDTLTLTITDRDNVPLAQFTLGGGQFAGKTTAGQPVTLSR
jgi:hypothetical protein